MKNIDEIIKSRKKIFSFYIEVGFLQRLKKISLITGFSVSFYIRKAIENLLEKEETHLQHLLKNLEDEEEDSIFE